MNLPLARSKDILTQSAGKELMVYDLSINKAFNLNETAAIVFNHCDGNHTFNQLKNKYNFTDDLIFLTLDELKRNNLMTGEAGDYFPGMNRREVIKRVGLATMIALPVISSLVAPTAASAQSATVSRCQRNGCVDGGNGCNPDSSSGCAALRGDVCCASGNNCFCVPADVCTGNGGQICPGTA